MARAALLLLLLAFPLAAAAFDITAQVLDSLTGEPISGADVFLQDSDNDGNTAIVRTDNQGRFSFNSRAPFALRVEHPDYEMLEDVTRSNPGQSMRLEMISKQGASLTAEEQAELARFASRDGRTVFLFPYLLQSEPPHFSQLLKYNLNVAINAHLQSLEMDTITVEQLPASLDQQGNRELLYGRALKALALVRGVGGALPNGNMQLGSTYVIVPGDRGMIFVRDEFKPEDITSAAFDSELNELWGQSTFLSIAYRQVEEATDANPVDAAALRATQDALIAFRRDLPDPNSLMAKQAGKLLATISARLEP